jgi:hypothetical protein
MFNESSTVEDRHEFIKMILARTGAKNNKDVPTAKELNDKVS